jgi:hypothetical protein
MRYPSHLPMLLFVLFFAFPVFAQDSKFATDSSSKELKRTAHLLHISAQQLKNARQALQEATDLARKMESCPIEQYVNLAQSWNQLNPGKSKEIIESFIQDLRSEAENSNDLLSYNQATSSAMMLVNQSSNLGHEYLLQLVQSWPEVPPESGDGASTFRNDMIKQALYRLANIDPENTLKMLLQPDKYGISRYEGYAVVAQGFMNTGKRDEALKLVDKSLSDFTQHSSDPKAIQDYGQFVSMTAGYLDSDRASAVFDKLIPPLMNQASIDGCKGTLNGGDKSVSLTCAEFRVMELINAVRMIRPGLVLKTIESIPSLKSKLDSIGGIDGFYMSYNLTEASIAFPAQPGQKCIGDLPEETANINPEKLFEELKGKTESNPSFVEGKLQSLDQIPESIDVIAGLAYMSSYSDPALGSLALEVAGNRLNAVEALERRSWILQNLVRAYKQVEGEVDPGLLRKGFALVDEMRQEQSQRDTDSALMDLTVQPGITEADRLEALLVSELARDSFEDAIAYIHSMEDGLLKLTCFVQTVQALSQ